MGVTARSRGIDALRGLAVLAVVFHHSFVPSIGVPLYDIFLRFFQKYGTLGVDLFFLLSGFCIHGAYAGSSGDFHAGAYLRRRWWRIYPPYFFALGLAVLLNLATNYYKWKTGGSVTWDNFGPAAVLSHVFLVHNFSPSTVTAISGPFWTIALEAQYYLFYLVVRRFFFSGRGWAAVFAGTLALHVAAWTFYDAHRVLEMLNPFRFWLEWVTGAFLAYLVKSRPQLLKARGRCGLTFVICAFLLVWMERLGLSHAYKEVPIAAGFACLILFFLGAEKWWSSKSFAWLPGVGLFSYSVYLVHFLFMDRIRVFILPRVPEGGWRLCGSILTIGLCLAAAYGFYLVCERPFLRKAASVPH